MNNSSVSKEGSADSRSQTEGRNDSWKKLEEISRAISRLIEASPSATVDGLSAPWIYCDRPTTAHYRYYAHSAAIKPCVSVARAAAISALARLRAFRDWEENWDAEGAPAPDKSAIDAASELLGHIKYMALEPKATLSATGHPLLLFEYPDGEGEIEVTGANSLAYMFDCPDGDTRAEAEVLFHSERLPQTLEAVLVGLRPSHT